MAKSNEKECFGKLTSEEKEAVINKPFSDDICDSHFRNIGFFISLIPDRKAKILELGCGTGWVSLILARYGYDVTGVDICQDMIEIAEKDRCEKGINNARFVVDDYESFQLPDEFDAVLFYESLHHAENEKTALACAYKHLKNDGCVATFEPGRFHNLTEHTKQIVERFGTTEKEMHPQLIIDTAKSVGFTRWEIYPSDRYLSSLLLSNRRNNLTKIYKIAKVILSPQKMQDGIVVLRK